MITNYHDCYTITYTLGMVENFVGMEQIGKKDKKGFKYTDLKDIKRVCESKGKFCELLNLKKLAGLKNNNDVGNAYVLVIRDFVDDERKLYSEQSKIDYDKQKLMRGKIVNSHARYNVCFGVNNQTPNLANGKGTIVAFDNIPKTKKIRNNIAEVLNESLKSNINKDEILAEGNHYYDIDKCYIGAHGDGERKTIFGVRVGADFPLYYRWFFQYKPVGKLIEIDLHSGDMYIMSEKASGNDWKKSSIYTLRHAAGKKDVLKKVTKNGFFG